MLARAICFIVVGLLLGSANGQTIFQDDFDDNSAGWSFESLTGNFGISGSDVVYGYDYSTVGIPEAPNSEPGDAAARGVRLRTNLTGLPKDQASISIEDENFAGKYTVQVDMWLNWPPDPDAIGTTIFGGMYVGDALPGDIDTNSPIQRGAGFIASSDGDCGNCDYILLKNQFEMDTFSGQYSVRDFGFGNQPGYDNTDANTVPANGALIDFPAFFPTFDIDTATGGLQNAEAQQPGGAAGFQWVTVTAEVDATAVGNGPNSSDLGLTSFTITNALGEMLLIGTIDNSQPDILDDDMDGDQCDISAGSEDICVNLNDPFAGDTPVDMEGRVSLAMIDFFAGAGSNTSLSFALYDNLKVTLATAGGLEGDFNDDQVVDLADYAVWRDNLGGDESALNNNGDGVPGVDAGDYAVWKSNFGMTSSGSLAASTATAIPEPNSLILFAGGLLCVAVLRSAKARVS